MAAADQIIDRMVEDNANDPWVRLMVQFNEQLERMAMAMTEISRRLETLADRCDQLERQVDVCAGVCRGLNANSALQDDRLSFIEESIPFDWEG